MKKILLTAVALALLCAGVAWASFGHGDALPSGEGECVPESVKDHKGRDLPVPDPYKVHPKTTPSGRYIYDPEKGYRCYEVENDHGTGVVYIAMFRGSDGKNYLIRYIFNQIGWPPIWEYEKKTMVEVPPEGSGTYAVFKTETGEYKPPAQ